MKRPLKKETRYREIAGIIIMLFALILFLSIASFRGGDEANLLMGRSVGNLMGPFGAWLAGHLRAAFGIPAYLAATVIGIAGWEILRRGVISGALERHLRSVLSQHNLIGTDGPPCSLISD